MLAMVCDGPGTGLRAESRPIPRPGPGEVLIEVSACGICRTDIHVLDGEVPANYPVVPGHEIVGQVAALGMGVAGFRTGERVGVPWLGGTCGTCRYCRSGRENLCDRPVFTGASRDGGFATHAVASAAFCFPLPDGIGDAEAAPLLCAGLIGWRAYRMAGVGRGAGCRRRAALPSRPSLSRAGPAAGLVPSGRAGFHRPRCGPARRSPRRRGGCPNRTCRAP